MLEKLFDIDLSGFIDVNREDFNFKYKGKTVIGEIKGVTSGVKISFISQLDHNVWIYRENHPEDTNDIISLLIVNPQRKLPPDKRETVQEEQIKLAERNNSLIIETPVFLNVFEKYMTKKISREDCWSLLSENTGILSMDEK